jgi:hypothetical protein
LRPVLTPNLVDSPIRRGCTPNPFSSKSRTSPRIVMGRNDGYTMALRNHALP